MGQILPTIDGLLRKVMQLSYNLKYEKFLGDKTPFLELHYLNLTYQMLDFKQCLRLKNS